MDQDVRVVDIEGKPWFVANDVCQALGLQHTAMSIKALSSAEVSKVNRIYIGETRGGKPWFVAMGVFDVLECPKGSRTYQLKMLDGDEVMVLKIEAKNRGHNDRKVVMESGLYKLIMKSVRPQAKPFQDWGTRVVLPSIRKTGSYKMEEGETIPLPKSFADAMRQHAETLIKRKSFRWFQISLRLIN